jgi:hypothetical protein
MQGRLQVFGTASASENAKLNQKLHDLKWQNILNVN